ncbi:hypothetical protein VCSRO184_0231 [Vibrio cholerae]|nr:hypothetical protein DN36_198 [Vibrio cholerae]GHX75427.1 hypothetical protein VCSRO110_0670 [Vibrio cholerae]GHZ87354.1 hypothetical protein VCSRO35_0200 [Vibrio cholerae]GIA98468.1 hypothetical protein VCSRO184_0231 [Vibrio cholerae]GIB55180.1 hypothetical protein VCSRO188_0008 [Vibrio cholerae]
MQSWTRLIAHAKRLPRILLVSTLLMVAACSTARRPSPTWPTNLNVIELKDGGICLDKASAEKLAAFKADLEAL